MITPLDILSAESWILIISLLVLLRYYLYRKWQFLAKLHIPNDPPSLLSMGNMRSMFSDAFKIDNDNKKKYGPIWGFYMGTSPNIIIHDLEILRKIFVKEFANFPIRQNRFLKINGKEMNESLISVKGDQWKRVRSSMTPTFSTAKLKYMVGLMEWCAENTVEVLKRKNESGDGKFNSKELFSRLSLDIVCSSAFSTKVHSQDDRKGEPEIAKHAKKLFSGSIFGPMFLLMVLFPYCEEIFYRLNIAVFPRASLEYFKKLSNHVIQQRSENDGKKGTDLMQLMLDSEVSEKEVENGAEKGMTRTEIIGNSMLMIIAGYENTGNTMGFLAYNLAQNPEIQDDLQREIDEMFVKYGKFDYESVNSLKLLDMCVNETLRLYNPILRNARYCVRETTINGFTIPKGMMVNIPVYALSHDPEYWDEPEKFNPERMRDMSQIDPMVFQPFGYGPRNCIGMRFALMEIKMSLSKILHKFSFKPAANTPKPPLELKFGVSVRSKIDFDLNAVPRKVETE